MKNFTLLFALFFITIGFNSCTRIYTTGSSNAPISTAPVNTKEKGDLSFQAEYSGYDVTNTVRNNSYYNFIGINAFRINAQFAVTDHSTIGMSYSYNVLQPFTGHTFNGMYNYGQNFETVNTKRNSQYGFDILSGFQIQHNNNFMEVSDYFYETYGTTDSSGTTVFYYDYDISPLGYYKLDQNSLRLYVQPSFTFENKYFELFFGMSIGYQQNLKYEPQLTAVYQSFIEDPTENNPLVYYNNNKRFLFGESFCGFGVGPEFLRVVWYSGIGYSTDQLQHIYGFGNVGVRSNFSALRTK